MSELRVLYRDGRFLAVDKPSGIVTTRDEGHGASLTDRVRDELAPDATMVHPLSRLDFEVSGVVLFALDHDAARAAADARARGAFHREYHGLVSPAMNGDSADWRWPIGVDPRDPTRRTAGRGRAMEDAQTLVRVRERRGELAWLELQPVTGRTHQLRVHCAKAGCPIVGDKSYRGARRVTLRDGAVLAVPRVMLHCARVSLGGEVIVESPWHDDQRALWAAVT